MNLERHRGRERHRSRQVHAAALEITGSHLHLATWESEHENTSVRCRSVPWKMEAAGLTFERGVDEFRAALGRLLAEEHLAGVNIRVVLGAEFCVTRYVTGEREKVVERVAELESECSRFLLLGQGQKLAASHVTQMENGDFRGIVSAFNRQALGVVLAALAAAELEVSRVNAAAVLMAGLVHQLDDENCGGLLLRLRDECVDVLVVDQGCLLLDVRPARKLKLDDLADFLGERKALLERFYGWHSLTKRRQLECVYLAADAASPSVRTQLLDQGLSVQPLSDQIVEQEWSVEETTGDECSTAALGALCGILPGTEEVICPDLLSVLHGRETHSLRSRLRQTLWPLAAAALLCMMFHNLRVRETRHSNGIQQAVALNENLQSDIDDLDYEREDLVTEIQQLDEVIRQTEQSSLTQLIASVAACLPDDGSLTTWMLSSDGTLQLQGRCIDEESAYTFVDYVSRLPQISRASLRGTRPGTLTGQEQDAVVEFDIVAEMNSSTSTGALAHVTKNLVR